MSNHLNPQSSRIRITDRYYTFLKVIWLISFILVGFCGYRLSDNIQVYLYLLKVTPEKGGKSKPSSGREIKVGDPICIEGKPVLVNTVLNSLESSKIIEALETKLGMNGVIFGNLTFTHTEGSGDDSSTVTDREMQFFRQFLIEQGGRKFEVQTNPKRVFSFSKLSTNVPASNLSDFSPQSTDVKILWFAPGELAVIGKFTRDAKGKNIIEGTSKFPLILSLLPLESLQKNIFYACLLEILLILFFLFSFLLPSVSSNSSDQNWIGRVKNQFEKRPQKFFIFDLAGGPEVSATKFFFLYLGMAALTWYFTDFRHSFSFDNVFSLFTLGYLFFMQIARGFEYFYVANIQDGKFYEVSRGFGPPIVRSICPVSEISPRVETETDSEGGQTHKLMTSIPGNAPLQISDSGILLDHANDTVNEFRIFMSRGSKF